MEYEIRDKQIIRTSVVGIVANILLALFKAVVGAISGSIAIIMDALNNMSDVLSGVITILGTRLSARPADSGHPFGHGRIEYFSAIVISIIVLVAGFSALFESVKKIIHPTTPTYTTVTLVVIIVAIFVKIFLGRYVKMKGEKLKSDSLIASGADATFDAVVTLATLVSAGIMLLTGLNLDSIFGLLISLVIIRSGMGMLKSPVNQLLGLAAPKELTEQIRKEVMEYPEVHGVNDIILNYYGPVTIIGSMHISILDTMTARRIHGLTRSISQELFDRHGIIATIGIYAINTTGKLADMEKDVTGFINSQDHVLQCHGFYYYEDRNCITIDVVHDSEVTDDVKFKKNILTKLAKRFPKIEFNIFIDHSYTEL